MLTEIDGRVDTFPAASRASTANVYDVPQLNPATAYDVELVCPSCDPFLYTVYPVTPTLSVEADQPKVKPVCVTDDAPRLDGAEGG